MPLREAVVQIAETIAPQALVRDYLAQPDPNAEILDPIRAAELSWGYDPYAFAVSGNESVAAWQALTEARALFVQALGDGDVSALIRISSGGRTIIPSESWRTDDAFEALRMEAQQARANGWSIYIETASFRDWLQRRESLAKRSDFVNAETAAEKWLVREMTTHPSRSPFGAKASVRTEAEKRFGVSARAFDRAWAAAMKVTGSHAWGNPGAKSKRKSERQ